MNSSTHLPLILLFAALGTESALAFPGEGPGARHLPPEADADANGIITREEMEVFRTTQFTTADTNGDSVLNLAELQAHAEIQHAAHEAADFARLDQNGDQLISEAEFVNGSPETDAAVAARVYALAVGGTTGLTEDGLAALRGPEGRILYQFAHLDTDGSGVLSLDEFVAPPAGGPGAGEPPPAPRR